MKKNDGSSDAMISSMLNLVRPENGNMRMTMTITTMASEKAAGLALELSELAM